MRIGIVGGGIGGLASAAALVRDGHEVIVFESRPEANAGGAALSLFDNVFAALDSVGLGDVVRAVSSDEMSHLHAGQRSPSGEWRSELAPGVGPRIRVARRVDLHRALLDELPEGTLRFGLEASVEPDGSPTVTTATGSEPFDLVIAADGLRSESRTRLGLDRGLRYAGFTAWRAITHSPVDLLGAAGETWGAGKMFGFVPLEDGLVYWFATLRTPRDQSAGDEQQAILDLFGDWHKPIRACIEATSPQSILRHDIYDLRRLPPTYSRGQTMLLGDAAHGMTPNLGQGAGQAIEDAVTLTLLLRRPQSVDELLETYEKARRPRTRSMWFQSRQLARIVHVSNPIGVGLRDAAFRFTPERLALRGAMALQRWTAPQLEPTSHRDA